MADPAGSQRVSLPVDNKVEDLLLWRDPIKSGAVLVVSTVIYFLLEWSHRSVIGLVSTLLAVATATSFLWSVLAQKLNKPGPPIPQLLREGVSESQVKSFVDQYTPLINKALAFVYRVATGQDVVLAVQVIGALIVIGKLSKVFTIIGWAYFAVLAAFSLPKLYELKKPEVDNFVNQAATQGRRLKEQHVDPVMAKIPRASSATPARQRPSASSGADPAIAPVTYNQQS